MRHEHLTIDFGEEKIRMLFAGLESSDKEYDDIFAEEFDWWEDVDENARAMVIGVMRQSAKYEGQAAGLAMVVDQLTEVGQVFQIDRTRWPVGEFSVDVPEDSSVVTFRRIR